MGDGLDSKRYSVDEVLQICMQDRVFYEESGGGVTISGGEPLVQWQFLMPLLRELKANKVHTAIETTGFVQPDIFHKTVADVDLLLFDVKHYADNKHKTGTGFGNGTILKNLQYCISEQKEMLLRIPVIPGFNDAPEDALSFSRLLNDLGIHSVQLLPFHQFGEKKYELLGIPYALQGKKSLHADELNGYRDIFEANGITAFF
jgi:pyruvate formate lyase activating enzyme